MSIKKSGLKSRKDISLRIKIGRKAMGIKMNERIRDLKWKNFFVLTIAGLINAFGVTVFLAPVRLYDSGISGTSMLVSQITPDYLTLSLFLILLNFPLFFYGLKKHNIKITNKIKETKKVA